MFIMSPFSEALYQICIEEGSTFTIELIRNKALAKLADGESTSLIATTVNGKSFSFRINKPADVLFQEATDAIQAYNVGIITASEIDFTSI